jgi:D-amino peptidase
MKILIAADMEGVSGVTCWEETQNTHNEYARFRRIMTEEVSAAIVGAARGGADEFVVADGHGDGINILIEEVDARAKLNSGIASPLSMMEGIDQNTAGVIFIGYHARAGSQDAVLAHTWSNARIANVWLNDIPVGEYGLNAAVAGYYGVPILMVTGDQTACSQAFELIGPLEMVVVKRATGYYSAECLSPKVSLRMIEKTAERAVLRLLDGSAPHPFIIQTPVNVTIEFRQPEWAERSERLPGAKRLDSVRITFRAPDMLAAYAGFRVAVN